MPPPSPPPTCVGFGESAGTDTHVPFASLQHHEIAHDQRCGMPDAVLWLDVYTSQPRECMFAVYQRYTMCSQRWFNHKTTGDGNCGCILANWTGTQCGQGGSLTPQKGVHVYTIDTEELSSSEHPGADGAPMRLRLDDDAPTASAAVARVHGTYDITGVLSIFVNQDNSM